MTYTSWITIENVIKQKNITRFKVLGDDESLIYEHNPAVRETSLDTANTLKDLLDSLEGNNHAVIKLITPEHKGQRGGNTNGTVYKYNYKLKKGDNSNGRGRGNEYSDNNMFALLLNMTKETERLRHEMQLAEIRREMEDLKKRGKDGNMSSLEKVALQIGRGFYQEMKDKNGLADDTGAENEEIEGTQQPEQKPVKRAVKPSRPEATEKDFAKRSGVAVKRLAKVGGLGVANALEDLADMAETDPMKLVELLKRVKG